MDVWALFVHRVPYVVGAQPAIVDALDWTEFDAAGHAAIALSLVTSHGRATPVVWQTVPKTQLKGRRNQYEDAVLQRLHDALPAGVEVTVLADRGFGDQTLYHFLTELGFVCIVRFRSAVTVTQDVYPLDAVVCVKARQTKEPSCLAVRGPARPGAAVVKPYGRRFTIEETFRDTKDLRYGLGLSATHMRDVHRRDRLLLICAMATTLLTVLGAAGECLGMDRMLKANTVKTRTHSLFRQGCAYYALIRNMPRERLEPLVQRFADYVRREPVYVQAFNLEQ